MDIQAYIASGILETYVLGELPPSEAREVEAMAAEHPQIAEALQEAELALETFAMQTAVAPPPSLKASILDALPEEPEVAAPAAKLSTKHTPIRPMYASWAVAASLGLALLSSIAAAIFFLRWQEAEEMLATVQEQNFQLAQNVRTLEQQTGDMRYELAVLANPAYQQIQMNGLDPAPEARAVVFWNAATAEVYLNPGSLPTPPQGKQYQLWAIVDGKPVDMGVFDTATRQAIQKMKATGKASAFAVTLEPKGGSPSPTLEQMYVLGEVS